VLTKLVIFLLIVISWVSCAYAFLSYEEDFSTTYVMPKEYKDEGFWSIYLYAVYWTIWLISEVPGEQETPETDTERYFMMVLFASSWHLKVC